MKDSKPYQKPSISFEDTAIAFANHSDARLRKSYLIFAAMNQNLLVKIGTFLIKTALDWHLPIKKLIKYTVFEHFCGGEDIKSCQNAIENLAKSKVFTILDYSVEGEDNEEDFDKTATEIKETILKAAHNKAIAFAVFKVSGLASTSLLMKVQEDKNSLTEEEKQAYRRVEARVESVTQMAAEKQVKLFFDAEETWIQGVIDDFAIKAMQQHNQSRAVIFNTYQMYCVESISNIKSIISQSKEKGFKVGVKLVRGAYMEKERERAKELNYKDPIQPNKEATDHDFDKALLLILDNIDSMEVCLGTHNQQSCQLCFETMAERGIAAEDDRIWFAQLMGMSDNISLNLSNVGYNVAKYVPYGPVESVMPYLFRRAAENTSIAGQSSREFKFVKNEMRRRKSKS